MNVTLRCPACRRLRSSNQWARPPYICACGSVIPTNAFALPGESREPLVVATVRRCVRCDAYPCLGLSECRHEAAIRRGLVNCPRGVWMWV